MVPSPRTPQRQKTRDGGEGIWEGAGEARVTGEASRHTRRTSWRGHALSANGVCRGTDIL